MEEKNSQENAIEPIEPIEKIETIETIETAIDIKSLSSETKSDILSRTKQHRENVDKIIVPQYEEDNYAVTYSKTDNSLLGWTINLEQNGQQDPNVPFKLDQSYDIYSFKLCKKTLLFCYYEKEHYRKYYVFI